MGLDQAMKLLRIYFDQGWFVEYLVGCDIVRESITLSQAFLLEMLL